MKCPNCGEELVRNSENPELWECLICGNKIKIIDGGERSQEICEIVTHQQKSNKFRSGTLLIIVAIVFIVIIICVTITSNKQNFLKLYPNTAEEEWCTIPDDGSYMRIDTNPYDIEDYFDSDAYYKLRVINADLGFSDALLEKMSETTALDGRQTDENDEVFVSWKYHPDSGLEVTYEWK